MFHKTLKTVAVGVLLTAGLTGRLSAEFLIYDGDLNFTESASGFLYYWRSNNHPSAGTNIPSQWPSNWLTPKNYYNGYWAVRYDIKSTPKGLGFSYQLCIWQLPTSGATSTDAENESCSSPYTQITAPGVYVTQTLAPSAWWQKNNGANAVDYARPYDFKRCGIVFRTAAGCYVTPYNVTPNCWDQRADYLPVVQHVTIVAVAAGESFSGWGTYGFGNPRAAAPTFTPGTGTYTGPQLVTIQSSTVGAALRYTTDGSTPTASSSPYSQALLISQNTTLKAIALKTGMDDSPVSTAVYTITADNTPPVIATVSARDPNRVTVTFNEAVESASATAPGNYAIDHGTGVTGASLGADKKTVTLTTGSLTEGTTYTLTVNNVKDLSDNMIAANSTKTFQYVSGWTDDFSDGNYTANQTWTVGEGTWTVAGGALGNTSAADRTSIYGGEATWTDITFTADVKPVSGTNANDVWLIFRVQDALNYYLYTLQTGKLFKLVNGTYTELASGSGTYTAGTTYQMKVELTGSSITVYRNGTPVLSANDNTFSSGKVGFGSNKCTGTFDNVEVVLPSAIRISGPLARGDGNTLFLGPNPVKSTAAFHFALEQQANVSLTVYDQAGREVSTLVSETLAPDSYHLQWDASSLRNGVYFYRLNAGKTELGRGRVVVAD